MPHRQDGFINIWRKARRLGVGTAATAALVFGATRCADLTAPASIGDVTIAFSDPSQEPLKVIVGDTIAPVFTVMIGSQVQQRARYVYSVRPTSTRLTVIQNGSAIAVRDRGADTIFATVVGATVGGPSNGAKLVDTLAVIAAPDENQVEFQPGTVNPSNLGAFGATRTLNATSLSSQNVPVVGGRVDWSTTNGNVVTVASIGTVGDTSKAVITAVGNGTAQIVTVFEQVDTIRTTVNVVQQFGKFRLNSSKNTGLTSIRFKSLTDTVTVFAIPQDSNANDMVFPGANQASVPAAAFALSEAGRVSLTGSTSSKVILQADANGNTNLVANVAGQGPKSDPVAVTVAQEAVSLTIVGLRQDTIQSLGAVKNFTANALDSLGRGLAADLIEWSSTTTSVASITGNNPAVALANAVGTTTIRAQAGAAIDQITLVVRNDPDRVALTPDTLRILSVNAVSSFAPPVVTNTKGDQLSGIPLTYHSLDSTIVLPQANGAMRGVRVGVTRVFVQTPGPNSKVDTSRVEVTNAPAFIDITPTSHALTSIGDSLMNVPITLRNSLGVDLHRAAANWRSGNDNIARVTADSNKTIIATGVGDTHIYAYSPLDSTTVKDSVRIVVSNNTASLTVSPSTTQTLTALGATINFTATARNTAGNVIPGAPIVWSVESGGTFVSINSASGVATALANGTAVVRATSNGITQDVTVNVAQAYSPAHSTIVPGSATLPADGTSSTTISIQLRDANNNALTFGGATVVPSTSRGTLGSVTDAGNGLYTVPLTSSIQAGTATIGAIVNTVAISTNGLVAFTAGAATQYLVTSTNLTPVAGTSVTIRAQLADANGNPLATPVSAVTFTSTNGGTFTGPNPATTDGTGVAQITFNTSGTVASHTITAATGALSGASPAINSIPGAATSYLVTPTIPTTVAVSSGAPITAQLRDANGNSVAQPGLVVTWSKSDPNGSFSSPTSTTNTAGLATVTLNTHSVAGTSTTVTATTGGLTGTSELLTTAAGVASTATTQITSNVANVTAGGQATITVQARDAQNNDLTASGGTVQLFTTLGTLSGVTDNANGTYTATLSTTTAGTATITGTINGLAIADNAVVTVSIGPVSAAHSVAVVGTGTAGAATNITVQARDAFGNNLTMGGSTVQVTVSGANTVAQFTATDVGNGTYTAAYTPTITGTDNVAITLGGTPISGSPYSSVVSAGTLANFLIATIPAQVAGGAFDITITARDASGNTVTTFSGGGNTVDISSTGTLSAGGGTTAAFTNGVLVRSVTISNTGSFTIAAIRTGGGPSGTSNSFSVTPSGASLTNSTIDSPDASRTAGQTSAITVTLRDGNNNPLTTSGGTVALTTNIGTLSAVTNNNNGTYSATFTATTVGTATISGTLNGAGLTDTHVITVTVGAADPANTIITAAPTSIAANGSATSTISVAVRDAFGNARDAGETVNLATTLGTLSANPATHAGGGVYTATLTAGTTSGTATVTGTLNSVAITDNATVTLTPLAATNYLVTPSSLTANAGTNVTVTAQLRDANNNAVAQAGKTVSWSSTNGGSFSVPTSLTNAGGLASNTFTVSTNAAVSHVITATDEDALTGSSATIEIIPAAPVAIAATAVTGTTFTANWNASSGAASYRLDVSTASDFSTLVAADVPVAGTSHLVSGLAAATNHFYRVRAVDPTGTSGNSNTITVLAVPAPPTITGITPGNQQLSVAFTAGSAGGSAITTYQYTTDNGATWKTRTDGGGTATPILITEPSGSPAALSNGTTYDVMVRAVNAQGNSPASNLVSATPATTPSAPTITGITPGDQQLSVAFTAGSSGGSAITTYQYSTDNGTTWKTRTDAGGTTTPIVITEESGSVTALANGTAYDVRIRAVNAQGSGAASNLVNATPATTPAAPTITGITPGDQQLSVAFTAGGDGGTTITTFQYTTDNGTTWKTRTDAGGTTTPIVITEESGSVTALANGTAYDVRIRALNAQGNGAPSNLVNATPVTTPAAPTISGITPTNQQLSVAFTAGSDGGSAITTYQYTTDNGTTWKTRTDGGGTASPLAITEESGSVAALANGTTYNVRIRAVNAQGSGAASNLVNATPATTPAAPTITGITPGDQQLSVAFTAGSDGGSALTDYQYTTDNGTTWKTRTDAGGTTTPIVITEQSGSVTPLANGTAYDVRIRAVNAQGNGAASNLVNATPVTTPAAPTITGITPTNQQLAVAFTAGGDGGSALTDYQYSTDNGTTWKTRTDAGGTTTPLAITEQSGSATPLANGTSYDVRIRAVNAQGNGAASNLVNATPVTTPAAPTLTGITPTNQQLSVAFTTGGDGGSALTDYQYSTDNGATWKSRTDAGGTTTPIVITEESGSPTALANGTTYQVMIRAVNAQGSGAASNMVAETPATTPDAPTINSVLPTTNQGELEVDFSPGGNGGAAITTYEYSTDNGATWKTRMTGTTGSPILITEESGAATPLANNTPYDVRIRAVNAQGSGAASSMVQGTTLP